MKYGEIHWKMSKWETNTIGHGIMQKKTIKNLKYEIQFVGPGLWRENWKKWKMRQKHCMTWNMARSTEKRVKWYTHSVGIGIWQETVKIWKIHTVESWILSRKSTNIENETKTLYAQEYGKKHWKAWKMKIAHSRTWNIATKLKNVENEKLTW